MTNAVDWHSKIAADFAAKYAHAPAFQEREMVWRDLIARYQIPGGAVLDAGCGAGVMTTLAAPGAREVLAFDASAAMLDLARKALNDQSMLHVNLCEAHFGVSSLLQPQHYDLILCSSVLEYLDDWWAGFDWLAQALTPGGTLLFSLPNGDSLYRHAERSLHRMTGRPAYYAHVRATPSLAYVLTGLDRRGFTVLEHRFYGRAPLLSPILRSLKLSRYSDTLTVYGCRRR